MDGEMACILARGPAIITVREACGDFETKRAAHLTFAKTEIQFETNANRILLLVRRIVQSNQPTPLAGKERKIYRESFSFLHSLN